MLKSTAFKCISIQKHLLVCTNLRVHLFPRPLAIICQVVCHCVLCLLQTHLLQLITPPNFAYPAPFENRPVSLFDLLLASMSWWALVHAIRGSTDTKLSKMWVAPSLKYDLDTFILSWRKIIFESIHISSFSIPVIQTKQWNRNQKQSCQHCNKSYGFSSRQMSGFFLVLAWQDCRPLQHHLARRHPCVLSWFRLCHYIGKRRGWPIPATVCAKTLTSYTILHWMLQPSPLNKPVNLLGTLGLIHRCGALLDSLLWPQLFGSAARLDNNT